MECDAVRWTEMEHDVMRWMEYDAMRWNEKNMI